MTGQLKTTLTELIQMAREGNRHAVPTLRQVLDATSNSKDRQDILDAIKKARRAYNTAMNAIHQSYEKRRAARTAGVKTAPVKPTQAPKISPAVFEMDAETASRWEIVKNAK